MYDNKEDLEKFRYEKSEEIRNKLNVSICLKYNCVNSVEVFDNIVVFKTSFFSRNSEFTKYYDLSRFDRLSVSYIINDYLVNLELKK